MSYNIAGSATLKVTLSDVVQVVPVQTLDIVETEAFEYDSISVAALATNQVIVLGAVVTGDYLFIKVDNPLTVKVTQTDGEKSILVTSFLELFGAFTAVRVTNVSADTAVGMEYLFAGDRT